MTSTKHHIIIFGAAFLATLFCATAEAKALPCREETLFLGNAETGRDGENTRSSVFSLRQNGDESTKGGWNDCETEQIGRGTGIRKIKPNVNTSTKASCRDGEAKVINARTGKEISATTARKDTLIRQRNCIPDKGTIRAQTSEDKEYMMSASTARRRWEDALDNMPEDSEEEVYSREDLFDALCELESSPIDINKATKEDLERIPFLTDNDVADILEYLYLNGPMMSTAEIAMISTLEVWKIRLLPFFLVINEERKEHTPKLKTMLRYAQNDLLLTAGIPLYERKGDQNGYLGYKYKHSLRYELRYTDRLRIGVIGAQDAGEPFFSGKNSCGYDFYSFYFQLRKIGRLRNLTLGRYRVRMGLGLIMNNDFSLGKTMSLSTLERQGTAIRPHSSRSDGNYMQGAAATVAISNSISASAFASYRCLDATLNSDSASIATIITSGYHRTANEMQKKNNSSQFASGASINYSADGLAFGLSGIYAALDKPLAPNTAQTYRRFYANGKRFYNLSADYGITRARFSFHGETATGGCHAWATINALSFSATPTLNLTAIYRYYSYKYYSLFSRSLSDGGRVQNESGIYVGARWQPNGSIALNCYSDFAYFPWAKYRASSASRSFDNMLSFSYTPSEWEFSFRYRLKMQQKDDEKKQNLIWHTTHRARLTTGYTAEKWSVKAKMDATLSHYKAESNGWMLSAEGGLSAIKGLRINASAGYFNTKDYESRIYCYERSMRYDFSFPSFYGNGMRYTFLIRADIGRNIYAMAKLACTNYFDRTQIGTGLQSINHSSATDVTMQLHWKF